MTEAELLCMVVMAEDILWGGWSSNGEPVGFVGFAAWVPQGLCPDCLRLADTPNPLVGNSAAKWSGTTGHVIWRCPGIQACLQAQSTAHDLKCQKMSGLPFRPNFSHFIPWDSCGPPQRERWCRDRSLGVFAGALQ